MRDLCAPHRDVALGSLFSGLVLRNGKSGAPHITRCFGNYQIFLVTGSNIFLNADNADLICALQTLRITSLLGAAKHLTKVFCLKDLPRPEVKAHRDVNAAVERVTQQAIAAGVKMPIEELRKEVEKRLKPALLTA